MTDTIGFPEAARRLGVPLRVLRAAIRRGAIPAPAHNTATATLNADWLAAATAAAAAPGVLGRPRAQTVAPFARYEGTSAWRKYRVRVREFYAFHAKAG